MSYKKRRMFYIILIGNIILLCNLFSVKPVSSFVGVGDNFHYINSESYYLFYENLEFGSGELEEAAWEYSEEIRILTINSIAQTIDYERIREGYTNNYTTSYGWESHISNYFEFFDLFSFNYVWDQETESPLLVYFDFYFYNSRFIESNWSLINTQLSEILDETIVVDTVTNPNDMVSYDITFGYFLGNLKSYKIQGRSSLPAARRQLSDSTTKWSFEFDLSGVLHYDDHYDSDLGYDIYLPVDKMILESTIEYTEDGARKYRNDIFEYENVFSDDNLKVTEIGHYETALGKLPVQLKFSYLVSIPAILFIALVVRIRKKKK